MKIVAFMQNPWFPPDTRKELIDKYLTDQDFHRRLLGQTMSGHRLKVAFGDEWFARIFWDNVAPLASPHASGITKPDMAHVDKIITEQKPGLILTFGTLAKETLLKCSGAVRTKLLHCHHPNARHHTQAELDQFAQEVRDWVMCQERGQG